MGFNTNDKSVINKYPFDEVQINIDFLTKQFNNKFDTNFEIPVINEKWLIFFP